MFTATASGVPEGQYRLEFSNWERSTDEEYGERVKWEFTVTDGPQTGSVTSRFTGAELRPKTEFGKLIFKAFVGHLPNVGEQFDPDAHLGKRFLGVVSETDSGATRVVSLMPVDSPASGSAAPPAAAPQPTSGDCVPF